MLHRVALLGVCSGKAVTCPSGGPDRKPRPTPRSTPLTSRWLVRGLKAPLKLANKQFHVQGPSPGLSVEPIVWIRQGHSHATNRPTSMMRLALATALCARVEAVISVADGHQFANAQVSLQSAASHAPSSYSPPHYPSPWMDPRATGWEEAYAKAKAFVSQMTLVEKVNLTTGTG